MDIEKFCQGPVVPIPPSFKSDGQIDFVSTKTYIRFLQRHGIKSFMTTVGTSQFNLLSSFEMDLFNIMCAEVAHPDGIILALPPLANIFAKQRIENIQSEVEDNVGIMAFYPDRYYVDDEIVKYFYDLADYSSFPLFIHGMPMPRGTGGIYAYNSNLINKIASHKNIVGMKEEDPTFEGGSILCSELPEDFISIVAGRSQKRFLHIPHATTFLAGLGNIYPELDIDFYKLIKNGDVGKAKAIIDRFETPFFEVFMNVGWHKALREGLRQKSLACKFNRLPFGYPTEVDKSKIASILKYIENLI